MGLGFDGPILPKVIRDQNVASRPGNRTQIVKRLLKGGGSGYVKQDIKGRHKIEARAVITY
jgi:hypothetical protein